jgi:hypothetical protein
LPLNLTSRRQGSTLRWQNKHRAARSEMLASGIVHYTTPTTEQIGKGHLAGQDAPGNCLFLKSLINPSPPMVTSSYFSQVFSDKGNPFHLTT